MHMIFYARCVLTSQKIIITSRAREAYTRLVLRLLYVFVSVCLCVCSSAIVTYAKLRYSITIATSAVQATGSLLAQ